MFVTVRDKTFRTEEVQTIECIGTKVVIETKDRTITFVFDELGFSLPERIKMAKRLHSKLNKILNATKL